MASHVVRMLGRAALCFSLQLQNQNNTAAGFMLGSAAPLRSFSKAANRLDDTFARSYRDVGARLYG